MNVIYAGFGGLLLLLIIGFYFYRRKKTYEKVCQKPDKPWNIPEEKRHLEQLKKTNKEEYNNVLEMMEQEYQSAFLWYKAYCNVMVTKDQYKKQSMFQRVVKGTSTTFKKIASVFSKGTEKQKKPLTLSLKTKAKTDKKPEKIQKKPREEPISFEQQEQQEIPVIDYENEREKQRRLKAILKAKRAQEKQRRKFKKPLY